MVFNSNLSHWLGGSRKADELRAIRARWDEVQTAWRASPIAHAAMEDPVGALALAITRESWERAPRTPIIPLAVALGTATADLLSAEDIGDFTPLWDAIEGDVSLAVEFREALGRRFRYATEFARVHGVLKQRLLTAYDALYTRLPDSCFGSARDAEGSFEVPLIELVEDPAELISEFLRIPYSADCSALGLFKYLRTACRMNVLRASGLDPLLTHLNPERLVPPEEQRNKTPAQLADLYLAGTPFRALFDVPVPFHVPEHTRFEHCHIVGGTGHGKTQLMQRMIHGDLIAAQNERRSVVVIDSQGDLINKLVRLELFSPEEPDSLADRLVLIDPADVEFPAALNLFDAHLDRVREYRPVDRERVLNGVVELYEVFFGDLLGAELTQKQGVIFKYLARLMLTIPGATIHTLMQLMEDGKPFRSYMQALDGSARYFFASEFFHPSFAATKRQILKRLWGVLSTPAFERMFAQKDNKLDLFEALQDGKIVLINTAKDLLKDEGSQLFGRFFIALLSQAAVERSTVPESERTPTFVYVDEAQEYFDDRIETILNQARKYRVGLTLAHQTLDQLSPRLRSALHANSSLKCAGGVSARDARALAEELHTTSDFIQSMKRRGGRTEFALWLKQETPNAIRLSVPLGFLEAQPILTEEAYEQLLATNRRHHCGTLADVLTPPTPTLVEEHRPRPAGYADRTPAERVADGRENTSYEPSAPARPSEPPRSPAPVSIPGKGGPQHKYLQQLVKQLAEERGFRAVIEDAVPGGHVDVGLHQGDVSVACEISVTSKVDYEAQNVAKCVAAGFGRVWSISADARRRKAIKELVASQLTPDQLASVDFLTPDDLVEALDSLSLPPPEEMVVRGYRVTAKRMAIPVTEAKERRAQIARILTRSLKEAGP